MASRTATSICSTITVSGWISAAMVRIADRRRSSVASVSDQEVSMKKANDSMPSE